MASNSKPFKRYIIHYFETSTEKCSHIVTQKCNKVIYLYLDVYLIRFVLMQYDKYLIIINQ